MIKCKCGREGALFKTSLGTYLCEKCFQKYVEESTLTTILKYKIIDKDDKVAVALSGEKDSVALLYVLSNLSERIQFKLIAISVDEGIKGYRDESINVAKLNTTLLGIEHKIVSFQDIFGFTIDDVSKKIAKSVCSLCGPLKRRVLNVAAREVGANKLATAHNMDDALQTFLMNLLDGRAIHEYFIQKGLPPMIIPRIKPFLALSQKEIISYIHIKKLNVYAKRNCPYAEPGMRATISHFLEQIESYKPDFRLKIFKYMIQREREIKLKRVKICQICGEISSSNICNVCKLLKATSSQRMEKDKAKI